jgi:hypothetical protein
VIPVYHYRLYDISRDDYEYPPLKSTKERIQRAEGEIIPGTSELVPLASLDRYGRLKP